MGVASLVVASQANAQPRTYRIGYIGSTAALPPVLQQVLLTRLGELGYREGRNLVVERRFIEGRPDRLPALAKELINLGVEVVVVASGAPEQTALAVKAASSSIPIVMAGSLDPVGAGLAASLAHPGGNVTGLTWDVGIEQASKRLQIYKEAVPSLSRIAAVWDSTLLGVAAYWPQVNAASKALGIETYSVELRSANDLIPALEGIRKNQPSALWLWVGPLLDPNVKLISEFAIKERLPALAVTTYYVDQGCLIGYSLNAPDLFRRAAGFVDKILKGAKPGELPIEQPTKFELAINLKTAKAIGLTIPQSLLWRADRVIE